MREAYKRLAEYRNLAGQAKTKLSNASYQKLLEEAVVKGVLPVCLPNLVRALPTDT